ncbi:MAG: cupin domain-containing protein [Gaiellaceae bacterium]
MRYCIQSDEEAELFGPARGCAQFEQRRLRFDCPGEASRPSDDELVYVLAGSGRGSLEGESVELHAGTAIYIAAGTKWQVESADGLEMLSVRVSDALTAETTHAVVAVDEVEADEATAGRMFRLLAPCASATQFVGYIPPGRAPDHFHRYDEVVYVLQGTGALHIDGESAPLRPGTCIHLPATLVHSLENTGPGEMHVLGVFRPAGSPAEAYYPDGTAASEY